MWPKLWTEMTNRSVAASCGLVVAAALLLVSVWWNLWELGRTWDYVGAAFVTSTAGTVEIVRCDAGTESKGNWTCHGPFTSDEGTIRIDSISLRVPVDTKPGSVTSAVVSGAGAAGAWAPHWGMTVGRLGVHVIAATAGFFAWMLFRLAWITGKRDRPVFRGVRTPRLPRNQHRNRRRRKAARLRRR